MRSSGSLTAFAARIGVRSQDLNNWKKRGIPRSRQKLVADALGWTLDHLLADDDAHSITPPSAPKDLSQLAIAEPMIGYPAPSTPPSTTARAQHPFDLPTDRYTLIPRRKIGLSKDSGALVLEAETPPLALDTEWLRRSGLRAEHAAVLYMQEDSMEPSIRQGDVLLVDYPMDTIANPHDAFFRESFDRRETAGAAGGRPRPSTPWCHPCRQS